MKNSTKAILFQLPASILLVLVAVASFYLKLNNFQLRWATPITIVIIAILYFIGIYFEAKGNDIF